MTLNNNHNRLKKLEEVWHKKLNAVGQVWAESLSNDELAYYITDGRQAGQEPHSRVMDWSLEAKLYASYYKIAGLIPKEMLAHLEAIEHELNLIPAPGVSPVERVNLVVEFLKEQAKNEPE